MPANYTAIIATIKSTNIATDIGTHEKTYSHANWNAVLTTIE